MKFTKELYQKIISGLVIAMVMAGATFLYNFGQEIYVLPETARELKAAKAVQDKINAKQDSLNRNYDAWAKQDYEDLKKIKETLETNGIR